MHGPLKLRLREIDEMTPGEIALALDDDDQKTRGPEGVRAMNEGQMAVHAARRRKMTAREKLQQARGW